MTNSLKFLTVFLLFFPISNAFANQSCVLTLGWGDWPPYQLKDNNQQMTGLDIELVKAITQQMNCDLKYVELPWERLLRDIKLGSVQMTASVTKTNKREQWANFSLPYRTEQLVLFTPIGSKFSIKSVNDLAKNNFKLGISQASYYGPEFEELLENDQFKNQLQYVPEIK